MVITINTIFDSIAALQSTGDHQYLPGIFPSQRIHPKLGYVREDNNIFFSSLVIYTLHQMLPMLTPVQKSKLEAMTSSVTANYPGYLHKEAPDTFNFWPNRSYSHFPNGWLLHRIPMLALPADTDDTTMVYLTHHETLDIGALKNEYQGQYPMEQASSPLTPKAYKDLRAYPTFLGKRIARELDACVICNVLLLMLSHPPMTKIDEDSITYLERVLIRRDHVNAPFHVSPNYANGPIILYHMARLVASYSFDRMEKLKALTIECLQEFMQQPLPYMEKLLLSSSLLRLGQPVPALSIKEAGNHFKNFYFFQAGMLTGLQKGYLKRLAASSFFHLKYRCEAYYWTLVLEYLFLLDHKSSKS